MTPPARPELSPLGRRGLTFALAGGLLLCWPMLAAGGPVVFADSGSYFEQGAAMARWLSGQLDALWAGAAATATGTAPSPAADHAPAGSLGDLRTRASEIRSLPYALVAHVSSATPLGRLGLAWAQGTMILMLLWPLVADAWRSAPRMAGALALGAALLTPLPLLTSYLMPDVFGGAVVLFALLLLGPVDRVPAAGRAALLLLAAFAIMTHYGNLPLAAACIAAALAVAAWQGRFGARLLALGTAPLALALAVNLAGSLVVSGGQTPSVTPQRMPILLARSMEDGPARWYLEEKCPARALAVCEVFPDGLPDTVHAILWGPGGLSSLDRATLDRVREEEPRILAGAFLRYPMAQARSLVGNALRQFRLISLGNHSTAREAPSEDVRGLTVPASDGPFPLRGPLARLYLASYVAGLAGLVLVVLWPRHSTGPAAREAALLVLLGLAVNAAVFGGLSAPAPRYQTRVAWLAPLLAALLWWRPRAGTRAPPVPGPDGR